jgi:amino acid adenylation domain-containing protein
VEVGTAKADLTWSLWDTPQGIHGAAEYSTDLFSSETINQLIDDFKKIIQVTAENPDLRIGDLGVRGKRVAEPKQEPWKGIADHAGRFFELTESQLLVWMGQQLEPDVPLYNVPYLFRIRAKVDRGHFDAAFQALVHSTDAMRLVFEEVGGIPRQRAIEDQACHLEHVDFSGHQNPEESFRTWGKVRSQKTIDLGGCPFDSVLAKISETEWFWFLNMHHIATDGWSLILLFQRLQELYRRSVEGRLAKKCPAYPRFLDYISRELAERSSSRDHADETYWSQRLEKGAESVSFYGTAPLKRSSKSRRVSCDLGETRSRELKGMAADPRFHSKSFRASLFNIFLGILAAYLYRISGTRDISVGAPFSNRKSAHAKGVVGLLMAVAPLRVRVEEEDTFLSLIYRARAEAQGASKHSTYSIGNFQAKNYDVVLNSLPMMALTFEDVGVEIDWLHPDRENESLSLHVVVSQKENICIHFDFHCDVFQESQHARAIQHFLKLMDAFLADPGREVERVSLLSPGERRQVLADFNAFDFQPENDTTLQAIFESRVLKTPERPAVCFGSTFLTYSSLNARANQLAHYLKEMGVGPDTVVGLCLDRSPELITGMLGILKAGGAYLPLDPTLPEARLSFMIEDTGTRIILTRDYLLSCLPKNGARLVSLDGEADAIGKQIGNNPSSKIHSDCLAYVMYTSGSTGIPKGVMISHKAICNRLIWEQKQYEMNEHDVVLQYFSPSFDFSVWEIFATLFAGAQLILYTSDANMVDANHIAALMRHHCVTIAGFVPSTLEMLLDERALAGCTSLQHVFCGGEPMSLRLQTEFHASLSARLTNTYGPTEASVDVAHWTCNREESSGNVPIGHPIGNTTLYILDARLEPVPQGVAGELFIGGIGLARGYFNQPALTAERFLPDPFSVGGRLYRTGDLARHRPDGAIEFLGRIDEQIKLRGFRIEPAEVRAALEEHPSVEQAVVLPGDELLLAFVTPWDGASGADLRDFLRTKLPHYMVPSRITRVASFPLTHNGKVDKVALLVHESPGQDRRTVDVLPKGELERTIAIIWKEVLKLDAVSTRESFFDLGGHSLLLAQVHSRLQARLGRTFPLIELFRHPTISTFARYLEEGNAVSSSQIRARARLQVDAIRRQAALSRERRISR